MGILLPVCVREASWWVYSPLCMGRERHPGGYTPPCVWERKRHPGGYTPPCVCRKRGILVGIVLPVCMGKRGILVGILFPVYEEREGSWWVYLLVYMQGGVWWPYYPSVYAPPCTPGYTSSLPLPPRLHAGQCARTEVTALTHHVTELHIAVTSLTVRHCYRHARQCYSTLCTVGGE